MENNIYENIVNGLKTGIAVFNHNKEIIFINKEGEKILNKGASFKSEIIFEMQNNISFEKKIERLEISSANRIIGASMSPEESNGKINCVCIFQDITKIKEHEIDEKKLEKLAHLGEFSLYLAHEVRNPLNLIKGFSQLMMESDDVEFIKSNLAIVISESDRLNRLASRLLEYTKKDELNIELININQTLKEMLKYLSLNALIEINECGEDINIKGDKEKMTQVFLNLIKNGIEAIESETNRVFNIFIKNSNDIKSLAFETNGKLEKVKEIKKIFEPFFTTKPSGTGLGLAITKKIIEEHNFKIFAAKNSYGGLTIKIVF